MMIQIQTVAKMMIDAEVAIATVRTIMNRLIIVVIDTMTPMAADKGSKLIERLKRIQITLASTISDKATVSNHLQEPNIHNKISNYLRKT